jgi:serine/threonine-protein kinase
MSGPSDIPPHGDEPLSERPTLDTRGDPSPDGAGIGTLPERIGPYEVLEEIARGGMGVVVRARQQGLQRDVAVKLMRDGWLATEGDRRRFRVEAAAAASLQHPGIVTIHEVGEHEGLTWFSMELIEGRSLRETLRDEGPMEPVAAAAMVARIADALDHAHSKGLLHRDLKPANVLLTADGRPKLTDFGIAQSLHAEGPEETGSGLLGTPSYMAPEQAAGGDSRLSAAADVYGLGALLYECLAGRPPFSGGSVGQVLLAVLSEEPQPPRAVNPRIPSALDAIVMRCLQKGPEDRYQSAAALSDDLRRFAAGVPVEAERGTWWERLMHWGHQRPALASSWLALSVFYLNEWVLFAFQADVDLAFHLRITALVTLWAAGAWLLQRALGRSRRFPLVRTAWSAFDVLMLTGVLLVADGPASPLVMAYPLLVLSSAFRWRMGLVTFVGTLSLLGYGLLVLDAWHRRPALLPALDEALVLVIAVACTATLTGGLVRRMRGLAGLQRS